jgi:hypothetical protein
MLTRCSQELRMLRLEMATKRPIVYGSGRTPIDWAAVIDARKVAVDDMPHNVFDMSAMLAAIVLLMESAERRFANAEEIRTKSRDLGSELLSGHAMMLDEMLLDVRVFGMAIHDSTWRALEVPQRTQDRQCVVVLAKGPWTGRLHRGKVDREQ